MVFNSTTSLYLHITEDCVVAQIFDGDFIGRGISAVEGVVPTIVTPLSWPSAIASHVSIQEKCDSCISEFAPPSIYTQNSELVLNRQNFFVPNQIFLVGAFLVKSDRLLQWLFFSFFSSDYNLTLIEPLFLQSKLLKLLRPSGQVRSPGISAKGSPFHFFLLF